MWSFWEWGVLSLFFFLSFLPFNSLLLSLYATCRLWFQKLVSTVPFQETQSYHGIISSQEPWSCPEQHLKDRCRRFCPIFSFNGNNLAFRCYEAQFIFLTYTTPSLSILGKHLPNKNVTHYQSYKEWLCMQHSDLQETTSPYKRRFRETSIFFKLSPSQN